MDFKKLTIISFQGIVLLSFLCSACNANLNGIDRFAVVNRHNIRNISFDTLSSLTVGNGKFAVTVDATGLQTFPELYENGIPLGTMCEWGWHSFPNAGNFKIKDTYKYYDVEGRKIPYAIQWNETGKPQNAATYFRENPHRLHMGSIGLELLK